MREIIILVDDKGYVETSKEPVISDHLSDKNDNKVDDFNDTFSIRICDLMPMTSSDGENKLSPSRNSNSSKNEKRKSTSNKKPPRPPRAAAAAASISLDAAEQKLIKEISKLATIKRDRIERMKALIKSKSSPKESSASSPTVVDHLVPVMLAVFLFCCIIGIALTQGCDSSRMINSSNSSALISANNNSLPTSNELATKHLSNLRTDVVGDGSPILMELVVGNKAEGIQAIH